MDDDIRCCGTGTCLINAEGFCWCGQRWDGIKMCFSAPVPVAASESPPDADASADPAGSKTPPMR